MPDSIGQQLQKARQARGMTIEEASQATHIRVHYLRALENDDREALPSAAQGRGLLRNYASFLGIAVQPLLDQWAGKLPASIEEIPEPAGTESSAHNTTPPLKTTVPAIPRQNSPSAFSTPPSPTSETSEVPSAFAIPPQVEIPLASRVIFVEIGEKLRQQREQLGLSFAEVERYTKLRTHYLIAMETGDVENLPSMVQCRGMLNNYAHFLNLDTDALMNRFADALQARRAEIHPTPEKATPNSAFPPSEARPATAKIASYPALRRLLSMDLLVVSGMIIILVAFVIWTASQVIASQNQSKTLVTAPALADVLLATTQPTGTLTPENALQIATPSASIDHATQAAGALLPASAGTDLSAITSETPTLSPGKIQLYVVVKQRSWFKVITDEKTVFIGQPDVGNAYSFNAMRKIELVTGNAAGLQVLLNQKDFGSLGATNQNVDLIFTADGIQTPTATPTLPATKVRATATPLPSATLKPSATAQSTIPGPP